MLKLDLLSLRKPERAADVSKWLVCKNDRAGPHRPDLTDELNVFDCFGEELQAAAVLFEKAQSRAIDLAVYQQPHQSFMAQAGSEGQLALCYVERSLNVAQP